jgi:hypothetical protein
VESKKENEQIKHKHHIVPKHMNGSDAPENIVEVTIFEHAMLHKQLWDDLGHWQDYIAWQGLLKNIDNSEIAKLKQSHGGRQGGLKNKGVSKTPEHRQKLSLSHKGKISPMDGKNHSEETLEKMRKPKSDQHRNSMKNRTGTWERSPEVKEKYRLAAINRWKKRNHDNNKKVV